MQYAVEFGSKFNIQDSHNNELSIKLEEYMVVKGLNLLKNWSINSQRFSKLDLYVCFVFIGKTRIGTIQVFIPVCLYN